MPRGGFRVGGSGNLRWKVALMRGRFRKNGGPHKRCTAVKKDGSKCRGVAIKNWHRCFMHGGARVLVRRGLYISKRVRHARFTESRTQRRGT